MKAILKGILTIWGIFFGLAAIVLPMVFFVAIFKSHPFISLVLTITFAGFILGLAEYIWEIDNGTGGS